MEKFLGVPAGLLNNYKRDFITFVEKDFETFNLLFLDEMCYFNEYYTGVMQNYIGSATYLKYKKVLFNGLFDTYARVRLALDLSDYAVNEGRIKRGTRNLIRASRFGERLTTSSIKNRYRDEKEQGFISTLCHNFGVKEDDENAKFKVALALENLAKRDRNCVLYSIEGEKLNTYFKKVQSEAFKRLESTNKTSERADEE